MFLASINNCGLEHPRARPEEVPDRGGVRGRSVLTGEGPDAFRLETFGPGPDGRERLLRTSRYVRT